MNPVVDAHVRLNQQTVDAWRSVESHRRKVLKMLRHAADLAQPSADRLAVLGAGNCNDLDLPELLQSYQNIELFDIDVDAVRCGVRRQLGSMKLDEGAERVRIAPPTDVTGIAELLSQLSADGEGDLSIRASLMRAIDVVPEGIPLKSFDVVVSICLLSQLILSVTQTIGELQFQLEVIQAIRQQHLQLLLSMLRPGGIAVLIVDFVSSDTAPELLASTEAMLPDVASQLVNRQNFFTGCNPGVIAHQLRHNAALSTEIAQLQLTNPWFWDLKLHLDTWCADSLFSGLEWEARLTRARCRLKNKSRSFNGEGSQCIRIDSLRHATDKTIQYLDRR
ncbi:MAG: hypothetical protein R3C05_20415 [Pirellulaceae bacterium]